MLDLQSMYIYIISHMFNYNVFIVASEFKTFEAAEARARHIAADDEVGGTEVLPDDPRVASRCA